VTDQYVIAPLAPAGGADFGVVASRHIKGGLHSGLADTSARDAITAAHLETGTMAHTAADGGAFWYWNGSAWVAFASADEATVREALAGATDVVSVNDQRISDVATPEADTDAANKLYVDLQVQGLDWKDSVRLATTANITLSGTPAIDGVTPSVGDRVLVKDQTDGEDNGIYVVAALGWTRATDADHNTDVSAGLYVYVEEGTVNGATGWVLTTPDVVLGTTELEFTQFSGAGQIVAGAGLTKTANQLDVVAADGTIVVNSNSIQVGTVPGSQVTPNFGVQALTAGASGLGATSVASLTVGALSGVLKATAGAVAAAAIVNADVASGAAIAGSKVDPNFGSQALTAGASALASLTLGSLSGFLKAAAGAVAAAFIVNADVDAAAAVAVSKLAAGAAGTVLVGGSPNSFSADPVVTSLRGSGTVAASGLVRGANNGTLAAARNAAGTGDLVALATTADDHICVGGGTNAAAVVANPRANGAFVVKFGATDTVTVTRSTNAVGVRADAAASSVTYDVAPNPNSGATGVTVTYGGQTASHGSSGTGGATQLMGAAGATAHGPAELGTGGVVRLRLLGPGSTFQWDKAVSSPTFSQGALTSAGNGQDLTFTAQDGNGGNNNGGGFVWNAGAKAAGGSGANGKHTFRIAGLDAVVFDTTPAGTAANQGVVYNTAGLVRVQGDIGVALRYGTGDVFGVETGGLSHAYGNLEVDGQYSSASNVPGFSATPTIDLNTSNVVDLGTATANITSLTLSNPRDGAPYWFKLKQDATGSRTVSWPAGVTFPISGDNVPTATGNAETIWHGMCYGAQIYLIKGK
jgi:hypothetical protein